MKSRYETANELKRLLRKHWKTSILLRVAHLFGGRTGLNANKTRWHMLPPLTM